MFHTTLSQGKKNTQEKGKGKGLFESKWKGQENRLLSEPKYKGQDTVDPGQRTGLLIICMYTNKPRSKDRAYDSKKPVT